MGATNSTKYRRVDRVDPNPVQLGRSKPNHPEWYTRFIHMSNLWILYSPVKATAILATLGGIRTTVFHMLVSQESWEGSDFHTALSDSAVMFVLVIFSVLGIIVVHSVVSNQIPYCSILATAGYETVFTCPSKEIMSRLMTNRVTVDELVKISMNDESIVDRSKILGAIFAYQHTVSYRSIFTYLNMCGLILELYLSAFCAARFESAGWAFAVLFTALLMFPIVVFNVTSDPLFYSSGHWSMTSADFVDSTPHRIDIPLIIPETRLVYVVVREVYFLWKGLKQRCCAWKHP